MTRLWRWIAFASSYTWDVVRSSVQVAGDVLAVNPKIDPAFVEVPLRDASELKLLLLSNLITFTPGTVFVDVATDGGSCVIHALYGGGREDYVKRLADHVSRLQTQLDHLLP